MIHAEPRLLHSPDLDEPRLPRDPGNCVVLIQAMVGPVGSEGEESFSFEVIARPGPPAQAGRGRVIVDRFEWAAVRALVTERVERASGASWTDVASQLNQDWRWEFDGYRPWGR